VWVRILQHEAMPSAISGSRPCLSDIFYVACGRQATDSSRATLPINSDNRNHQKILCTVANVLPIATYGSYVIQ